MAFHALAFAQSVSAGEAAITPVDDDVFAVADTYFFVSSSEFSIFAAFGMSANLKRARVSYPSVRQVYAPYIRPIEVASAVPTDPNMAEWLQHPLVVPAGEALNFEAEHSGGSPESVRGLVLVARQLEPAPAGPVITVRGTSTTASVGDAWTQLSMLWGTQGVGPGRYAVVGAECVSASPFAFRLRFDDQGYRPGGLSQAALGGRSHPYFINPGMLGVWGYFGAQVMPRVEVLATASAVADHTIFLQIVKID